MLYLIKEPLRRRHMPGELIDLVDKAEIDHLLKSGVIEPIPEPEKPPAPAKKPANPPASKSTPKDKVVAIKPAPEPLEGA